MINLDKRQDRWDQISNHLTSLALAHSRVPAIDGLTLEVNSHSIVPRAVDACWRSHQLVFSLAAQNPGKYSLILEDDAMLNGNLNWPNFLTDLEEYMSQASIDVLQLGFIEKILQLTFTSSIRAALRSIYRPVFSEKKAFTNHRWDCIANAPANLKLIPDSFEYGTHCYAISHRAAKAFVGLNMPTFTAPDDFFITIARDQSLYQCLKIARTKISLASQRSREAGRILDSDLEPYASG